MNYFRRNKKISRRILLVAFISFNWSTANAMGTGWVMGAGAAALNYLGNALSQVAIMPDWMRLSPLEIHHQEPIKTPPRSSSHDTPARIPVMVTESSVDRHCKTIYDQVNTALSHQPKAQEQIVPAQQHSVKSSSQASQPTPAKVTFQITAPKFMDVTHPAIIAGGPKSLGQVFAQSVNFELSVDGKQAIIHGNPDANVTFGMNVNTISQSDMQYSNEFSAACNKQNEMISKIDEPLCKEIATFSDGLYNLTRSDAVGAQARIALAEMKPPLPLFEHYSRGFKDFIKMHGFNGDSVKITLSPYEQREIARACDWYVSNSLGRENGQSFLELGIKNNVPGFALEERATLLNFVPNTFANIYHGVIDRVAFTFTYFTPEKIRANAFNTCLNKVTDLCGQGKFIEARAAIDTFSGKPELKQQLESVYQQFYQAEYNQFGIKLCYESDPYFKQIAPGLSPQKVPNSQLDQIFSQRQQLYADFINKLEIQAPTLVENQTIYHLVDQAMNGTYSLENAVIYCSQNIRADDVNPLIAQAYDSFFDKNGVMKLVDYDHSIFNGIAMPETIGSTAHTDDQILLNRVLIADSSLNRDAVQTDLKYIVNSCLDNEQSGNFHVLAENLATAIVFPETDQRIIHVGDLTGKPEMVPLAVELLNERNNPTVSSVQLENVNNALDRLSTLPENASGQSRQDVLSSVFRTVDLPGSDVWKTKRDEFFQTIPPSASENNAGRSYLPSGAHKILLATSIAGGALAGGAIAYGGYAGNPSVQAPAPGSAQPASGQPDLSQPDSLFPDPLASNESPQPCPCACDAANESFQDGLGSDPLFNEMQTIGGAPAGIAASAKEKEKKDDCNEPATKIPELVQKLLAEAANAYFREQIVKHEKEIIKLIEAKLKEKGLVYPYPIMIKDIDMAHVMFPDWNAIKKEPTGLHSDRWCPERIIKEIIPAGQLGTWYGEWQLNCELKKSTFFPSDWDEKIIINKIIESLTDIRDIVKSNDAIKITGITHEGIFIKTVIVNTGKIKTTFPLKEFGGQSCIY